MIVPTFDAKYETKPGILVSFYYFKLFQNLRPLISFRDYVLDSGAFSVANAGKTIDLYAYTEFCRELLRTDPQVTEIYSLDVIGDWRITLKNTELMVKAGVPAIPAYHAGEPVDALLGMARDYPKIALGGAVGMGSKAKLSWARQCFARVWPKPIHGFGFGSRSAVMALPFHSVDASNWASPTRFGNWKSMDVYTPSTAAGPVNLRAEIEDYLRLEREATFRWGKQAREMEDQVTAYQRAVEGAR